MIKRFFVFVVILGGVVWGDGSAYSSERQNGKYVAGIYFPGSVRERSPSLGVFSIDTVYSFPAPGSWQAGLAWDGTYLWMADGGSLKIYKIDTTGIVLAEFPNPPGATCSGGLEWDGSYLWFVSEEDAKLFKIDTVGWTTIATFDLWSVNAYGIAWDGDSLWHSQYGSQKKIFKLNPSDGSAVDSFIPPTDYILAIAWVDGYLYGVDCWDEVIYQMDPNSGSIVDSTSWPIPYCIGLTWDGFCWWAVSSKSPSGNERIYKVCGWPTGVEEAIKYQSLYLSQNYPNPVTSGTYIEYTLSKATVVTLKVYDVAGRAIRTLVAGHQKAGIYRVYWDGTDDNGQRVASGIYFYRLEVPMNRDFGFASTGDFKATKKLTILR